LKIPVYKVKGHEMHSITVTKKSCPSSC